MKKLFILFVIISITQLNAQVDFEEVLSKSYEELPFGIRVENSGVYGITGFEVEEETFRFNTYDERTYLYRDGKFNTSLKKQGQSETRGIQKYFDKPFNNNRLLYNKCNSFATGQRSKFYGAGGSFFNPAGENIDIKVSNNSEVIIELNLTGNNDLLELKFPGKNVAYSNLVGVDKAEHIFLLVESYLKEKPPEVKREIYTVNNEGEILTVLRVPTIKYLTTISDFTIDESSNLYHLLSDEKGIEIVKWSGLTSSKRDTIDYPEEYNRFVHFNDYVSKRESKDLIEKPGNKNLRSVNRTNAIKKGERYVYHQYYCTSDNLAPNGATAEDGDEVETPWWLKEGWNARVPYKWGGFNTLSQFDNALGEGIYAGDTDTDGVSAYAVGVDCSGFVSRCWGLSYHASTSYMPDITHKYGSWDKLKPGDVIHKVGHVRLFVARNRNGGFKTIEAAGRDWDVSYWTYAPSDLYSYDPRWYRNIEDNYSEKVISLYSAKYNGEDNITLRWDCDTDSISHFKIYFSTDGKAWTELETIPYSGECKFQIEQTPAEVYYKVAAIENNGIESFWSNAIGIGIFDGNEKYLIVNGFERDDGYGNWQGVGHDFAVKYGAAFAQNKISFETIKNSELTDSTLTKGSYDAVFWILGDESTKDETFSDYEQNIVKQYLQEGGNLFLSGSEVGWDLDYKGSQSDKQFYNNYLKTDYSADDANSTKVTGEEGNIFEGLEINIGQTYLEDYPDVITVHGGSELSMRYSNNKGAGITFKGDYGTDSLNAPASLVYLAFPLETTADDSAFCRVIDRSIQFFNKDITDADEEKSQPAAFKLYNNYPNPFNPTTNLSFYLPKRSEVKIKIYDMLGRLVETVYTGILSMGKHNFTYNAEDLSSGNYLATFIINNQLYTRKLSFIK